MAAALTGEELRWQPPESQQLWGGHETGGAPGRTGVAASAQQMLILQGWLLLEQARPQRTPVVGLHCAVGRKRVSEALVRLTAELRKRKAQ